MPAEKRIARRRSLPRRRPRGLRQETPSYQRGRRGRPH
jgi:hypothetical protein